RGSQASAGFPRPWPARQSALVRHRPAQPAAHGSAPPRPSAISGTPTVTRQPPAPSDPRWASAARSPAAGPRKRRVHCRLVPAPHLFDQLSPALVTFVFSPSKVPTLFSLDAAPFRLL